MNDEPEEQSAHGSGSLIWSGARAHQITGLFWMETPDMSIKLRLCAEIRQLWGRDRGKRVDVAGPRALDLMPSHLTPISSQMPPHGE